MVADALLSADQPLLGFTDIDPTRHGSLVCGHPVLGNDSVLLDHGFDAVQLINGIGGTRGEPWRRQVQLGLLAQGWRFAGVRHPCALVSAFAKLAEDIQVLAAAVIQVDALIGQGCIVNTGAVIEHGVTVGDYVHIAPRALLCGDVTVGAHSHIGAGAVIRQGVRLGEGTVVGAGAVVVDDFLDGGLLVGVPARLVGSRQ